MCRSVLPTVFRLTTLCSLAIITSACSTTPDRYAFWRDGGAPAASTVTTNSKPNLADIPAAPDVTQARADMQDLQKKLAADRDAAYRQAQNDKTQAEQLAAAPLAAISDNPISAENLPPVGSRPQPTITDMTKPQGAVPSAPTPAQPAMQNPNRPAILAANGPAMAVPAPGYPVYTPPSVQINPAARPYAATAPTPDYVYGRSGVQYRQRMNTLNGGSALTPPGAAPSLPINNQNITVDMSALGGSALGGSAFGGSRFGGGLPPMGRGPFGADTNAPSIFFNHGSTRLSAKDRKTLSALAATAKQNGAPVRVVGHASSRAVAKSVGQAKAANLKISADRTAKVLRELERKGVNAEQLEPAAFGDNGALRASSEAAARRVDILIGE